MSGLRQGLKKLVFGALGKDPEAVVVSFFTGDEKAAAAMAAEIRRLVPDRRHFVVRAGEGGEVPGATLVSIPPGGAWRLYWRLRRAFRPFRIGQSAMLFTSDGAHSGLRRAAFLLAPGKVLAYNARLERHHLRLRTLIASALFLRSVPLDRIFLRPWKRDRSAERCEWRVLEGRLLSASRRRVAILSPYFPYPLSHGGAVRIFHLLREASREFDIFLFAFEEDRGAEEYGPVLEFCARVVLVEKPRYREPRWSTLEPPEVREYRTPVMQGLLDRMRSEYGFELLQVEYTQLASYGGDVLVEHDVTFDLYRQVHERRRSLSSWWDLARWRHFEFSALRRYRRVVAMSEKDARIIGSSRTRVIANGVDLDRFQPEDEPPGERLLFIGSFRHFPNIVAYRFFTEQVWPLLRERVPEMTVTCVAGPDAALYWRASQDSAEPPSDDRIELLGFVRDVRPLYVESNLVIVPTLVSAGTNVKVLEAMAMERAVVSTASGCAGLGLVHGESVWIADDAAGFAEGVARLTKDASLRRRLAQAARRLVEERFDWKRLGEQQRDLWNELLPSQVRVRPACERDLDRIVEIQAASPEAANWEPRAYLAHDCLVAEIEGSAAGFLASRRVGEDESEILNVAVAPEFRRRGVASALLREALRGRLGRFFLEVRASNHAARTLYHRHGFRESGLRPSYYDHPPEDGIVMRL